MRTFLGIEGELATLRGARVVLLPVPFDATATFHRGASRAPEAVLVASEHIEEHDEELGREPREVGIHVAAPVAVGERDPERLVAAVCERVAAFLEQDKFVITLGGDHSVAIGAARAHARRHPGLSFLQIDAHGDLRDQYNGSPLNHACVARRLWELGPVTQVGLRSISSEGAAFLAEQGREPVLAHQIARHGADDGWIDRVLDDLGDPVYVTFDVDGLDPSIMPATGTPEPGGLTWWQALGLLRRVAAARRVVGADVCELLPTPGLHACDVLVARLIYKMVGYFA